MEDKHAEGTGHIWDTFACWRDRTWTGAREVGLLDKDFMATPPSPEAREALSPRLTEGRVERGQSLHL